MVEPQFKNDECGNIAADLFNEPLSDKYTFPIKYRLWILEICS